MDRHGLESEPLRPQLLSESTVAKYCGEIREYAIDRYICGRDDPGIAHLEALESSRPSMDDLRKRCQNGPQSVGTSLAPVRSNFTDNDALPGLSACSSVSLSPNRSSRINHNDAVLTLPPHTHLQDAKRDPPELECPFGFLQCSKTYPIEELDDWFTHSLQHFLVLGSPDRNVEPPRSAQCCFCELIFENEVGVKCWAERMKHVAWHHHAGRRLSHARPDFMLFRYLWEERLISNVEYSELLKGTSATVLDSHTDSSNVRHDHRDDTRSRKRVMIERRKRTLIAEAKPLVHQSNSRQPETQNRTIQALMPPGSQTSMSSEHDSTPSGSSEEDLSPSSVGEIDLVMMQAKHKLLVTIMKDVYTMFGSTAGANIRSIPPYSQSGPSGTIAQSSNSGVLHASKQGRGQKQGRQSQPGDDGDGNGKRRKKDGPDARPRRESRRFACPFYKYDPLKYSINSSTGAVYRTCTGPGFSAIARIKQHLRKVHRTTIGKHQCPRCWLLMPSEVASIAHSNDDIRCEKRDPPAEDIGQVKMDLIDSNWGASWEKIYEILFPGAPIPSAYYEDEAITCGAEGPGRPGPHEMGDYESYCRRELPRVVEARLTAMLETEMAPVAERLRELLAEILPSCQSTVAEGFRNLRALWTDPFETPQPPASPATHPMQPAAGTPRGGYGLPAATGDSQPTDFAQQPPLVNIEDAAPHQHVEHGTSSQQIGHSHLTTSTFPAATVSCICACHLSFDIGQPFDEVLSKKDCGDCRIEHLDLPDLGFEDLDSLFDN